MEEIADRTAATNSGQVEPQEQSKNARKKAEKQKKLADEKANNKSATNTTKEAGRVGATRATNHAPKKKPEGAALIGIDVAKENDFSAWYQQVLTKGDMLDYYDISGCYILKVGTSRLVWTRLLTGNSLPHTPYGKRFKHGSTRR